MAQQSVWVTAQLRPHDQATSTLDAAPSTSCSAIVCWKLLIAVYCTNLQSCSGNWWQDDWSLNTSNFCIPGLSEDSSKDSIGRAKTRHLCTRAQHQASLPNVGKMPSHY